MREYVTTQNERLDKICAAVFGNLGERIVERVLDLNRDLGDDVLLPEGTVLLLPDDPVSSEPRIVSTIKLWGSR